MEKDIIVVSLYSQTKMRMNVDCMSDLYERMCKLSIRPDFRFNRSDRNLKIVENFHNTLRKKYGDSVKMEFVYHYLTFQFGYWIDKDTQFGKNLKPGWLFGKKAFTRWLEKSEGFHYKCDESASRVGISIALIEKYKPKVEVDFLEKNDYEEQEKRRFLNESNGFVNCTDSTTLYNHKSEFCEMCSFKSECKQLLKATFPNIYINRGYLK